MIFFCNISFAKYYYTIFECDCHKRVILRKIYHYIFYEKIPFYLHNQLEPKFHTYIIHFIQGEGSNIYVIRKKN